MWLKWLPWRFVISRVARSYGFLDPMVLWAKLHQFAQPSEIAAPVELLRAGAVFHARGLINARAIQHNLDWVWPHWIERQFDPRDPAFVPRAFSITHINLTHRNWTAVGMPDRDWHPIVDPRGMVTPLYDGWSVDTWVIGDDGRRLLPSRAEQVRQQLMMDDGLAVATDLTGDGLSLRLTTQMVDNGDEPVCRTCPEVNGQTARYLVVAIRPANPEGVSFIHDLVWRRDANRLEINGEAELKTSAAPDHVLMSTYRLGDVLQQVLKGEYRDTSEVRCGVGLATAALVYRLPLVDRAPLGIDVPYRSTSADAAAVDPAAPTARTNVSWQDALQGAAKLRVPDGRMTFLYDAALRTLVLHAPGPVYPGPYTYKRFWYRDAAMIVHAMLLAGLTSRAERAIDRFPLGQRASGYFHSQDGEWDSNGEVLWIIEQHRRLTGRPLGGALLDAVDKGVRWICRKRLGDDVAAPHGGLMPSGFSAEHLGPNDYFYWDDFWSVAGLRCAAAALRDADRTARAAEAERHAEAMMRAIDRSLDDTADVRDRPGIPASPYRRMDAGAIGSIICSYPLALWPADDPRLGATVDFLLEHCMVEGGFFQDMMHSGINAYLTLHLAQALQRAGDERSFALVEAVAQLASPTGQWPEAIHPKTFGGCMGDGQHVWAAAEWVAMMRNLFVREEADRLVLCEGIPESWLRTGEAMSMGPTPTSFGPVTVHVRAEDDSVHVTWQGRWRGPAPEVDIRIPSCPAQQVSGDVGEARLPLTDAIAAR